MERPSVASAMSAMKGQQPTPPPPPESSEPSGAMPVRHLKVALFKQATPALLQTDINDFCAGRAVTGPPAFAANFSGEHTFIGLQVVVQADELVAILSYAD